MKLVPETLEELFEFERSGNVMRGVGIGIEGRKKEIKDEIEWRIEDDQWDGPGMLKFNTRTLSDIWESADERDKIAIKEILEEFLSGKKKWRKSKMYALINMLAELDLLFDPKYMVLTPSTWESIGYRYPQESKKFAMEYFKPNQIYSVGVNMGDPDMMKEGIKKGATNLGIGGTDVFEIPLKTDDGELLQLLLDKSEADPGELFVTRTHNWERRKTYERDESNKALRNAARDGKINTFKVLFNDPRSNPAATNNFALKHAIRGGYWDIVDLLLTDERVREKVHLIPKTAQQKLKDSGLAKEYGLFESVNFERGEEPGKSMGIGKHSKDLKVYRCGQCGTPTDKHGHELKYGSPEFQRTVEIIDQMDDQTTEKTWCDTCANDAAQHDADAEARYEAEIEWQEEQWRREHGY